MEKYLEIGKIVNTRGVRGELKIIPLTDDPERFSDLETLMIQMKDKSKNDYSANDSGIIEKQIEYVKYYKNAIFVKLKGLDDIESVEGFKDHYVLIDREHAIKLPDDTYFICDLVGSEVFEREEKLGTLVNILPTGSNDVYIVRDENGSELLIPALKSVVKKISCEDKRIDVELPKGIK